MDRLKSTAKSKGSEEAMAEMGLAEAIRQLRAEILSAVSNAEGEELQFGLGDIELELQVDLVVSGEAKADFKWIVVSLGAEAKGEHLQRHRVKLTLSPAIDGKPVKVSREGRKRPE
jgi:hypothetical protein